MKNTVCLILLFLVTINTYSQNYEGTEFWFGFMNNADIANESPDNPDDLCIYLSSKHNSSGTISIPLQSWSVDFSISAGNVTKINIPKTIAEPTEFGIIDNKGIHIISDSNISVNALNARFWSADGTAILPLNSLDSEYYLLSYTGTLTFIASIGYTTFSEAMIVATEDNTKINITPSTSTSDGHSANVTYSITLNKGETYHFRANSYANDLSGSKIIGDAQNGSCKNFAVFTGTQSGFVPDVIDCDGYADHLYEMSIPTKYWDKSYYIFPTPSSPRFTYKIIAKENNTIVKLYKSIWANPTHSTNIDYVYLDAGQLFQEQSIDGSMYIEANYDISVAHYFHSSDCSNTSETDPSMLILNSNQNWDKDVVFSTHNNGRMNQHYINILIKPESISSLNLDNQPISDSNFTEIPEIPTRMSYASIPVLEGTHHLTSNEGFKAFISGTGNYESYLMHATNFNDFKDKVEIDTFICSNNANGIILNAPLNFNNVIWYNYSNANDTISIGNTLTINNSFILDTLIASGINNVTNCRDSYFYFIDSTHNFNIELIANADTVCRFSQIEMSIQVDTLLKEYQIEWFPAHKFTSINSLQSNVRIDSTGWYGVKISSPSSCSVISDSLYIVANESEIISLMAESTDSTICFSGTTSLSFRTTSKLIDGQESNFMNFVASGSINNACEEISDYTYLMDGPNTRILQTNQMNLTEGGYINFRIKIPGNDDNCDQPELGENIRMQYSTDFGVNWTTFWIQVENQTPDFKHYHILIPSSAMTANTILKWSQVSHSGENQDVWMIDEFMIEVFSTSNLPFQWSPSEFLNSSISSTPIATISKDTYFKISVSDNNCIAVDSIKIYVDTFDLIPTQDIHLCSPQNVDIISIPTLENDYNFNWNLFYGINDSIINILADKDLKLISRVTSPFGCLKTDTFFITVDYPIKFLSGTGNQFCAGDTNLIDAKYNQKLISKFEYGINPDLLGTPQGGTITNTCSYIDNKSLYFSGQNYRYIRTKNLDLTNGGEIAFYFTFGSLPCDPAEINENVEVQYSVDGINYISIKTLYYNEYNSLSQVLIPIPEEARTSNTIIQWRQYNFSDIDQDVWMLDEVAIDVSVSADLVNQIWFDENNNTIDISNLGISGDTTFYVEFSQIDNYCPNNSDTLTINVTDLNLNAINDTILCSVDGFQLNAEVFPIDNTIISWNNASFISNPSILNPTILNNSNFTFIITATNGSCSKKDTVNISNYDTTKFNFENEYEICNQDSLLFDLSAINNVSFSPANYGNLIGSTLLLFPDTNYNYIINYSNQFNCNYEAQFLIKVKNIPNVVILEDTILCPNFSINILMQNTKAGESYLWNWGLSWNNGEQSNEVELLYPDEYSLISSNECGSDYDTFNLYNYTVQPINLGNDLTLCENEIYTLSPFIPLGATFEWSDGTLDPTMTITAPTTVSIIVIDSNSCQQVDNISITYTEIDTSIYISQNTIYSNENAATYQWIFCNPFQSISGAIYQTFSPIENGQYALIITKNSCIDTSTCILFDKLNFDNLIEYENLNNFTYYPNPTKSNFVIEFSSEIKNLTVDVNDVTGRKMKSFDYDLVKKIDINIDEFSDGIYFINLKNEYSSANFEIIKKN